MPSPNIIDDGYTITANIEPVHGHYDCLVFTFRPLLQEQFEAIEAKIEKVGGERGVEIIARALASQIVSWSESVPPSADSIRRIRPPLFGKVYRIISGMEPYAVADDATEEEQRSWADQFDDDKTPAERLIESEGNSGAASA